MKTEENFPILSISYLNYKKIKSPTSFVFKNGNLVLRDFDINQLWSTNIQNIKNGENYELTLKNNGNLEISDSNQTLMWETKCNFIFKKILKRIFLLIFYIHLASCFGKNDLTSEDDLNMFNFVSGCFLISRNQKYKAVLDYNVLRILSTENGTQLWSANNALDTSQKYKLRMQGDGNLAIYTLTGNYQFGFGACCCTGLLKYEVILEDDGKLRIYRNDVFCGLVN